MSNEERPTLVQLVRDEDWPNVLTLLTKPQGLLQAGISNKYGRLPLHWACERQPPVEAIRALLRAHPPAAYQQDASSQLPLHWACEFGASVEVILELLAANPGGTATRGDGGCLPLHYSCRRYRDACEETVLALLATYPDGAAMADRWGMLPIHLACHAGATPRVIRALLRAYPDGARKKDRSGRLPIHIRPSIGTCMSTEVVKALIDAYPDGVSVPHPPPHARTWSSLFHVDDYGGNTADFLETLS